MAKSKEKKKSKRPSRRWEAYKVEGDKVVKVKRECPKCGRGYFLAFHKDPDRYYCGKCHYVEFASKSN